MIPDDNMTICTCCRKRVDERTTVLLNDLYKVCPDCYENEYYKCIECGALVYDYQSTDGLCLRCSSAQKYRQEVQKFLEGDPAIISYTYFQIKNMRSEPLMTDLRTGARYRSRTEKIPFDILQVTVTEYYPPRKYWITYEKNCQHAETAAIFDCTMTEFKKDRTLISRVNRQKENSIISRFELDNRGVFQLYKYPIRLRAITALDKDYRKEWKNGVLVYEGNNYGDTSDFYVIGEIANDN